MAKILIVDDDVPTVKMLDRYLTDEGYDCSTAYNATGALKLCAQSLFDVVVTDVNMPGQDGLTLTREIKKKYDSDVIVISGYAKREDFSLVIDCGASDFIEKPINLHELKIRIEQIIRERQTIAQLNAAQDQLRNLSAYLQLTREREKKEVATEIHDELGQNLVALKMDLAFLKNRIPPDSEAAFQKIESMEELLGHNIKLTKKLISKLRPFMLEDLGLGAVLEWELYEFKDSTGIDGDLSVDLEETNIDDEFCVEVFRIFQTILANINRHAEATTVNVNLTAKDYRLVLSVQYNGLDIMTTPIARSNSLDLMEMQERIRWLDGEFAISGAADQEMQVKVTLPIGNRLTYPRGGLT